MRVSDSFTMSFYRSFDSFSAAALLCLASLSAVASSASIFRWVSSTICSFCFCIIFDSICRVASASGVEEVGGE